MAGFAEKFVVYLQDGGSFQAENVGVRVRIFFFLLVNNNLIN